MKLVFRIEYRTKWGESIKVVGNTPELGLGKEENALPLTTTDGVRWTADTDIKVPTDRRITYYYLLCKEGGEAVRREWNGMPRLLHVQNLKDKTYLLQDSWKDIPDDSILFSSAFSNAWMRHSREKAGTTKYRQSIVIKAGFPCHENEWLYIAGSTDALGNWNTDKAVPMSSHNYPEWQIEFDASTAVLPFEYKFICKDVNTGEVIGWEDCPNRYVSIQKLEGNETVVIDDLYPELPSRRWRGAGVCVPVFSLRSEGSFGVGDFGDLKQMAKWAAQTGQKIVQILPIYDTTINGTWSDSYPYNSISVYALHPMYLDLRQLPPLRDKRAAERFSRQQKKLNALSKMDYEAVNKAKRSYMELSFKESGQQTLTSEEFLRFFDENRQWLVPYAAFSVLRDTYGTADFRQWPKYSVYKADEIERLCSPKARSYNKVALYYYVQYHLDRQLKAANTYAHSLGVALKGDIPIGISRDSVEAWTEPQYFNMNSQAGAPPDDFSVNGQNWGFPTYNWDVMKADGYAWWTRRLRQMSRYFDAYRIDHILGFFRIWDIPLNSVHGLLGQFSPSLPLSVDEIERFGFRFNEQRDTHPCIHDSFLSSLFGDDTGQVKTTFLNDEGCGTYSLKPEFDTQRKIQAYFAGKDDERSVRIREGLYSLVSDVLFIRDRHDGNLYHPRISAQSSHAYQMLDDWQKSAFNNLYNNYYYHRQNDFWEAKGMEKLPRLIEATGMLACGEDLGMIPACVPVVMHRLHILSLEIQRMPKALYQEFANTSQYPYSSVSTFSTHDMSTLRGWWTENPEATQRFYTNVLGHIGKAPAEPTPELCEDVLKLQLASPSMLCIQSLQDWLSMDGGLRSNDIDGERINIPAVPRYYWRYRMHLTIEQLLKADGLNQKISGLIKDADR